MKTIIELNDEDIRSLVAKEFNVIKERVFVGVRPAYCGQELCEHKEYEVYATIINEDLII